MSRLSVTRIWLPSALYVGLVLILLGAASAHAQKIYRWVDAEGRTQFSQTPPPGSEASEEVVLRKDGRSEDPARAGYCSAVQRYAGRVADAMNRGARHAHAIASARSIETEIGDLIDQPAMQEVVNYIYTYVGSRQPSLSIANQVHTQCMRGNFGRLREGAQAAAGDRADAPARPSPAGGRRGGSGFVVGGRIATNHHVIDGGSRITVYFADGRSSTASVEASDPEADLAILRTDSGSVPRGLPLAATEAGMGAQVFTLGFPLTTIMGANAKLSTGIVNSQSGLRDDPRTYQVSVPVQGGNSGGPLLNLRGEVVGVITAKLAAERVYRTTGDLPQNVNYAVKARYLLPLLSDSGESFDSGSADLETLVERIKPAVVRIEVE